MTDRDCLRLVLHVLMLVSIGAIVEDVTGITAALVMMAILLADIATRGALSRRLDEYSGMDER